MLISKTVDGALRLIGVLAAGEEASPQEHADGLERLNGMIDGFNLQGLTVSYLEEKSYLKPTAGWSGRVTIGATGDIVDTAPISVLSAFFRDPLGIDFKMTPFSITQWSDQFYKGVIAPPMKYTVQHHGQSATFQFDTIPFPSYELHIMCKMPYASNHISTDDITWDYGFEEMLRYQLAVRLAPEYGVQLRQDVAVLADEFMTRIKSHNMTPLVSNLDGALQTSRRGWYDINSGTFR